MNGKLKFRKKPIESYKSKRKQANAKIYQKYDEGFILEIQGESVFLVVTAGEYKGELIQLGITHFQHYYQIVLD